MTRPLVDAEIARCKAAAGDTVLRAGVLTVAEDSTIAVRWIFDDNVDAIVSILDLIVRGGESGVITPSDVTAGCDVSVCHR